jgi:hypothetical protein
MAFTTSSEASFAHRVANLIHLAADPHDQPFVGQQALRRLLLAVDEGERHAPQRKSSRQGKQGPAKHGRELTAIKLEKSN